MTGRKLYILRAAGLLLAWALLLLLVFLARVWQGERKLREPGAYLSGPCRAFAGSPVGELERETL